MGRHAVVGAGGAAMRAVASASGAVSEVAMSQPFWPSERKPGCAVHKRRDKVELTRTAADDSNLSAVGNVLEKLALCHGAAPCWAQAPEEQEKEIQQDPKVTHHTFRRWSSQRV